MTLMLVLGGGPWAAAGALALIAYLDGFDGSVVPGSGSGGSSPTVR